MEQNNADATVVRNTKRSSLKIIIIDETEVSSIIIKATRVIAVQGSDTTMLTEAVLPAKKKYSSSF